MESIFFNIGNIIYKVGDFIPSLHDAGNGPVDRWILSKAKTSGGTKKGNSESKYRGYYYPFIFRVSRENISYDGIGYKFDSSRSMLIYWRVGEEKK